MVVNKRSNIHIYSYEETIKATPDLRRRRAWSDTFHKVIFYALTAFNANGYNIILFYSFNVLYDHFSFYRLTPKNPLWFYVYKLQCYNDQFPTTSIFYIPIVMNTRSKSRKNTKINFKGLFRLIQRFLCFQV